MGQEGIAVRSAACAVRKACTLAVVVAAAALPPSAFAGEAEGDADDALDVVEEPRKKRVIVIREEAGAPRDAEPPAVGDDPYVIEDYLRGLKDRTRDLKLRVKEARRNRDPDEAAALHERLRDEERFYDEERERLTERSPGLIAGGAVLSAMGGASVLASLFLVIGYGLSAIDGDANDALGWASLGTLVGGMAGIGGGGAMLGVGLVRRPKEVGAVFLGPDTALAPAPGLTLSLSF